ncbi:MAG TPA: triose-phosphate isomerase [Candidatus Paceibacterota bacterium]|nr:triose-phosphate isomerase [Candidatus Paceibacterota bacterium]
MSKIIIANWKMNPQSPKEAEKLFSSVKKEAKNVKNTKIIVCPPFLFLHLFKKFKHKNISLGAQNVAKETEGSFTGEISSKMLSSMEVSHVIVGHGERRSMGETNEIINAKILNLLKFKIFPVLCVGEGNRDKEGFYLSFVADQVKDCLKGVTSSQVKNIIMAYEPLWAIGKDASREATKEEFMEMKIFIRKIISDLYGSKVAHNIPVLYGGSVNYLNAKSFIEEGADGLLIGRDSLNPQKFSAILNTLK